jgi:hypothetical protein
MLKPHPARPPIAALAVARASERAPANHTRIFSRRDDLHRPAIGFNRAAMSVIRVNLHLSAAHSVFSCNPSQRPRFLVAPPPPYIADVEFHGALRQFSSNNPCIQSRSNVLSAANSAFQQPFQSPSPFACGPAALSLSAAHSVFLATYPSARSFRLHPPPPYIANVEFHRAPRRFSSNNPCIRSRSNVLSASICGQFSLLATYRLALKVWLRPATLRSSAAHSAPSALVIRGPNAPSKSRLKIKI